MRMHQVSEDDLEVMERELPRLADFCSAAPGYNERKDIQESLSMLKEICSNVRWNYGPPSESHVVGGDEECVNH